MTRVSSEAEILDFVRAARDPDAARRLWAVSEELTGVRFSALDAEG